MRPLFSLQHLLSAERKVIEISNKLASPIPFLFFKTFLNYRSRIWTDISFLMREVCYQIHTILQSGYRDLNSGPLEPKSSALAKLSYTPKWNSFVLLLPSASTFIEGISRNLAPVYYPPYGHSSSFCGTLLQGLSTTYVSHLPFLILYKYYNKFFIKNQVIF